jgi:nucleoside-diphosphate-sugar epimerase
MENAKKVFLIGPGFIGAEVLDLLVHEGYKVTTLVRREIYSAEISKWGSNTVLGSLDERSLIEKHASESNIVIHTATADHLPSVEAVLDGVQKRASNGESTIFIHTSGASQLSDDSEGGFKGEKIFSDNQPESINALPDSASHREIDLAILRARKALSTKAKIAIILPPLIYGVGKRSGRLSIQLPTMVRFAMKHGYAAHIGKGLSVWSQVHVSDLAKGYMVLLHWMEKSNSEDVLKNPYFFCENGTEISWGEAANEIGEALHASGNIADPTARSVPPELYDDLFGKYTAWVIGSNSRTRGVRLRELGWSPIEKGTLETLTVDEIPLLLKENGDFHGYTGVAASGAGSS